jgi:hypothetical protein
VYHIHSEDILHHPRVHEFVLLSLS